MARDEPAAAAPTRVTQGSRPSPPKAPRGCRRRGRRPRSRPSAPPARDTRRHASWRRHRQRCACRRAPAPARRGPCERRRDRGHPDHRATRATRPRDRRTADLGATDLGAANPGAANLRARPATRSDARPVARAPARARALAGGLATLPRAGARSLVAQAGSHRRLRRLRMSRPLVLAALAALLAAWSSTASPAASARPWVPAPGTTWQWQLSGRIDQSVKAEMYDIDLFDTSAATVASLHRAGAPRRLLPRRRELRARPPGCRVVPGRGPGRGRRGLARRALAGHPAPGRARPDPQAAPGPLPPQGLRRRRARQRRRLRQRQRLPAQRR